MPAPPAPKPISISTRLANLLPFSRRPPPPSPKSVTSKSAPPRHQPIRLEEPLPYLQAFTPLEISSIDTLITSSTIDEPYLQQQQITLTSPEHLLRVELQLTVDATIEAVHSLSLVAISPWADSELGTWIRKQAPKGDISSIGWACGRFWEVASIRATCWKRCQEKYSHLLPNAEIQSGDLEHVGKVRSDGTRARTESPNAGIEAESISGLTSATGRNVLLAHMGSQSLLFTRAGVSLLIVWHICFDWTGEVENHVSASGVFPASWRKADKRASLGRVGELFEKLVQDRGVSPSVEVVVRLLFPD